MASNESDGGKGSGGAEGDVIQRKVYVHGTRGLNNDDIRWIFEHYGQVNSITIKEQGFAFVEMANKMDADDAIEKLEGYTYEGNQLHVEQCKGGRKGKDGQFSRPARGLPSVSGGTGYMVVCEHLTDNTSWQDLKDLGKRVAMPKFARTFRDDDNKLKGVIEFNVEDDRSRCIDELSGSHVRNNPVQMRKPTAEDKLDNERLGINRGSGKKPYDKGEKGERGGKPYDKRGYGSTRGSSRDRKGDYGAERDRDRPRGRSREVSREREVPRRRSLDREREVDRSRSPPPRSRSRRERSRSPRGRERSPARRPPPYAYPHDYMPYYDPYYPMRSGYYPPDEYSGYYPPPRAHPPPEYDERMPYAPPPKAYPPRYDEPPPEGSRRPPAEDSRDASVPYPYGPVPGGYPPPRGMAPDRERPRDREEGGKGGGSSSPGQASDAPEREGSTRRRD